SRPTSRPLPRPALLLLALLLPLLGCNRNPTEPNRTLTYAGTFVKGAVVEDSLHMNGVGNARAMMLSIRETAADGTPVVPLPAGTGITMGLGPAHTPGVPTGNFLFLTDPHVSIGLEKGDYCLRFSESGVIPDASSLTYELQLEVTD